MTPVLQTAVGLAIPFVGTALGAAAVFLFKSNIPPRVQKDFVGLCFRRDAGSLRLVVAAACF